MNIAGREIGPHHPPYCVAEISGNHLGSLDRALILILAAKMASADAVKFQCYEADTITIDHDGHGFILEDGPWKGRKLYDLYREAQTPFKWFPKLFEQAEKAGITAFASVFDNSSIDLLEGLGCPAYKISSFEITDIPLIEYAAKTGKPLIISTGMADNNEIEDAYEAGNSPVFLHCTSGYPTPPEQTNLWMLTWLRERYGQFIGLSDHTIGIETTTAATALGACIIEKHLTLARLDGGPDAAFSLEPNEFMAMVEATRMIWASLQPSNASSEAPQRQARRSLYVVQDIKAGEVLTTENVQSIRPAYGLSPKELPNILGKIATCDISRGTPLSEALIVQR